MLNRLVLAGLFAVLVFTACATAEEPKKDDIKGAAPELCEGAFAAIQAHDTVYIFAGGLHRTGGYKVALEKSAITIFPPEHQLVHVKPTGPVTQEITPFQVLTSFSAKDKIEKVTVHDAGGKHEVPVVQVKGGK